MQAGSNVPEATATPEVRPRKNAEERWLEYLDSLPARGLASDRVSIVAVQLWNRLNEVLPLPPPDASPTNGGGLLMSWDRNGRHVEIEIEGDASWEWFYRHRIADVSEAGTGTNVEQIPNELIACLMRLFA
jgi:hypothetical protein